ncbi:MAG: hypothetical protein AB8F94_30035 [Saprospiraceae bacterium]
MILLNRKCYLSGIVLLFIFSGCVQFKKASLYDGTEPIIQEPIPTNISLIVESRIYDEDATDVWGLEKDICQEGSISDVAYSGKESIKISWNRDAKGCKFAGIGIGWDNWAGKDLSSIMDKVAIQMYVRTQKGRAFGLPMVLTLIDYSDGMGFCYTTNKFFERSAIDENWQKVVVPLSSFETEKENLDPSNIKQLQIELQQSGSVYLDDISLVFYEEQPQTPWMVEETLPDATTTPRQIFDDAFINNNAWGMITDECQTFELTDKESSEGNQSLHLIWNDANNCNLTSFGASWNKWKPVDLTPIYNTAGFEFDLKMANGNSSSIPLYIGFEDYDRAKTFVKLKSDFVKGGQYSTDWKKVVVPISAIPKGVDLKKIKQLYFNVKDSGEVYIDNIKLIKL